MGSIMTVENISDADFLKLQQMGWLLVCVDNYNPKKFVYSFRRAW
jgi:hypothetical protein